MAARITRAKKKIAAARIPYVVPEPDELPARLDAALTVIHLLYTTGHTAPSGDALVRDELTDRALDLARMLRLLLPDEREAAGLLALLLVHEARRGDAHRRRRAGCSGWRSRTAPRGTASVIAEADGLIVGALQAGPRRALHAAGRDRRAARRRPRATRRPTGRRSSRSTTRCCASGRRRWWRSTARSPSRWSTARRRRWRVVEALERDGRLAGYRYLPSTKADLLRRLGRDGEAAAPTGRRSRSPRTPRSGSSWRDDCRDRALRGH